MKAALLPESQHTTSQLVAVIIFLYSLHFYSISFYKIFIIYIFM